MQSALGAFDRVDGFVDDRIVRKLTLFDGLVYAAKVLINNSSGAQVHMPYFGVAHLSGR